MNDYDKIQAELKKLKKLKAKANKPMTGQDLKKMNGFQHLSDEDAEACVEQLKEYVDIVLQQMFRLELLDLNKNAKSDKRKKSLKKQ